MASVTQRNSFQLACSCGSCSFSSDKILTVFLFPFKMVYSGSISKASMQIALLAILSQFQDIISKPNKWSQLNDLKVNSELERLLKGYNPAIQPSGRVNI